jgi:hypothetical protein
MYNRTNLIIERNHAVTTSDTIIIENIPKEICFRNWHYEDTKANIYSKLLYEVVSASKNKVT